jgi:hypothetical protein
MPNRITECIASLDWNLLQLAGVFECQVKMPLRIGAAYKAKRRPNTVKLQEDSA